MDGTPIKTFQFYLDINNDNAWFSRYVFARCLHCDSGLYIEIGLNRTIFCYRKFRTDT